VLLGRFASRLPPAALRSLAGSFVLSAFAATASPLRAQLKDLPVYGLTAVASGLSAGLDYGSGLNAASGRGRHVGGHLSANRGRLRVSLAGGLWDPGRETALQLGGTIAVRALGNRQHGFVLEGILGAGAVRIGPADTATRYLQIPAGVVLSRRGVASRRGPITPWVSLRAEVDRIWFAGNRTDQTGLGAGMGASVQVSRRLGLHGALDWLALAARSGRGLSLPARRPVTVGLGMHFLVAPRP
jgi:hypothetical protein